MKFLVILGLLLLQQSLFAKGTLSRSTRYLLESGEIFKLELLKAGIEPGNYSSVLGTRSRLEALREINSSPELLKEAQSIVKAEHGTEKLNYLDNLLSFELAADSLGVELNLNTALVVLVAWSDRYATKDDLDEVVKETKAALRASVKEINDHTHRTFYKIPTKR